MILKIASKTPEPKGEEIEGQPPTVESLKNSDENGIAIVHEDWTVSFLSHDEVSDLLEIHSRLNKKNKDNFEDKLSKSQESASDMLHYFQERIKGSLMTNHNLEVCQAIINSISDRKLNDAKEMLETTMNTKVSNALIERRDVVALELGQGISEAENL